MAIYKDLLDFSNNYPGSLFNAYTRAWYAGMKLEKHWHSLGRHYLNPFCAENEALLPRELCEAMEALQPYWKVSPLTLEDVVDSIETKCIDVACDTIKAYLLSHNPAVLNVCICSAATKFERSFDYTFVFGKDVFDRHGIANIFKVFSGCDIWIEGSSKVLQLAGAMAIAHTIYNPYSYLPMRKLLFSNATDYRPDYEEYLVVGWNIAVRAYEYSICDLRDTVINAHYMHYAHETDEEFEEGI